MAKLTAETKNGSTDTTTHLGGINPPKLICDPDGHPLTGKRLKLLNNLLNGVGWERALRDAGYSPHSKAMATRLMKTAREILAQRQEQILASTMTREECIGILKKIATDDAEVSTARISAISQISRICGYDAPTKLDTVNRVLTRLVIVEGDPQRAVIDVGEPQQALPPVVPPQGLAEPVVPPQGLAEPVEPPVDQPAEPPVDQPRLIEEA